MEDKTRAYTEEGLELLTPASPARSASLSEAGYTLRGPDPRRMPPGHFLCMENLLTMMCVTVFIYEGFVYNAIFLHRTLPAVGKHSFVLPCGIVFNVFWSLAFWSWLQAHLSDPGMIPDHWIDFVETAGDMLQVAYSKRAWQPGRATYCQECNIPRPERAHHCRVCNICVLRMDHHCPFIKNCVGWGNYKYFLLLLIYGCLATLVALATSVPELLLCLDTVLGPRSMEAQAIPVADAWLLLLFGALTLPFLVLFPPMASFHLPLAAYNQTKIENSYDNMSNPYNLGTDANIAQVFGPFGCDWLFPIRPWRRKLDGTSFPRSDIDCWSPSSAAAAKAGVDFQEEFDSERLLRIRYKVPYSKLKELDFGQQSCAGCLG